MNAQRYVNHALFISIDWNNMRRKIASIALTAMVAGGLITATAAPANAAIGSCSSTYFCGWFDLTYTGAGPYGSSGDLFYVGLVPNDQFTSVYNHGVSSNIRAYQDANYTGYSLFVGRGSAIADLRKYPMGTNDTFNDKITSFYWL